MQGKFVVKRLLFVSGAEEESCRLQM